MIVFLYYSLIYSMLQPTVLRRQSPPVMTGMPTVLLIRGVSTMVVTSSFRGCPPSSIPAAIKAS